MHDRFAPPPRLTVVAGPHRMVEGVPDAETWKAALDKYQYPVDLRQFTGAREHQNWFNLESRAGDRLWTMGFEARFREHAGHHLEAWGEVVFWKLYTMGLVRNGTTQQVLDSGVSPDELWSACTDYIENGSKTSFRIFRRKLIGTPVVATAATFPAFICPERFPMVDRQITRWASKNGHLHRYSGVGGPDLECVPALKKSVLTDSHWQFIQSWIAWCRFTARELSQLTALAWRARDVEIAVFTAQRDNRPLSPLT